MPNCPGRCCAFVGAELRAEDCLGASGSFSSLLAMMLEQGGGCRIECSSGLSSLEGARGLRDLQARRREALGDHGGGGSCVRGGKMKGALALEKEDGAGLGWPRRRSGIA